MKKTTSTSNLLVEQWNLIEILIGKILNHFLWLKTSIWKNLFITCVSPRWKRGWCLICIFKSPTTIQISEFPTEVENSTRHWFNPHSYLNHLKSWQRKLFNNPLFRFLHNIKWHPNHCRKYWCIGRYIVTIILVNLSSSEKKKLKQLSKPLIDLWSMYKTEVKY